MQPYADSPLDEEPVAETVYLNLLARAEQYVYIYTPYLAVGEEMLDALKNAAKRGWMCGWCCRASGQEAGVPPEPLLLPAAFAGRVRIYEYTPASCMPSAG